MTNAATSKHENVDQDQNENEHDLLSTSYAQRWEDITQVLDVDRDRGLESKVVRERQRVYGPNQLRASHRRSVWSILWSQFQSIVVLLLVVAAVVALATQRWPEGIALVAVTLVNTLIGFFSEWKAVRSMEALRALGKRTTRVRRGGKIKTLPVDKLVPGDIVLLGVEDYISADVRLVEAKELRVNEAPLTGESVPVDKSVEPVGPDTPLAERTSMLYSGTTIMDGSAVGVVVATGMDTELGRIAQLTEEAESTATPLQRRLDRLGQRLAWITIAVAALVAVVGLLAGRPPELMITTAIALGVAAIPEGLPIVATIALARGMWLMAKRNALVHKLTAVETLGATNVICTDKTGTLTENRMTLRRIVTPDGQSFSPSDGEKDSALLRRALEIGVLCNNAKLGESESDADSGDPTEVALLRGGQDVGIERQELLARWPERREEAFDSDTMLMATYHKTNGELLVAVKGAPRAVLDVCDSVATGIDSEKPLDEDAERLEEKIEQLANDGLRLLAVADKTVDTTDDEPYEGLRFVGLLGLVDPPRQDVKESIEECQNAGIRVVMVTGDQPETGQAIGKQVGIVGDEDPPAVHGRELLGPDELSDEDRQRLLRARVFARVSPEQKLHLVQAFQEAGLTVAMTGDGINDAPALKKADIGVAMGKRGTDAAREAADMVLRDDKFSTIVAAVRQGRVIFGNIRKAVVFMLCTNLAEILAVTLAALVKAPLPLLPLQILYLNVLTDVFPGLALGVGPGSPEVMNQGPRAAKESVLTRSHWMAIFGWSGVICGCVLGALAIGYGGLGMDERRAVTISFLTLAFGKLWFVFNLKERNAGLLNNDVVRNRWIWGSLAFCACLLLLAVYWSPLAGVLHTTSPGPQGWALVLAFSLVPVILGLFVPGIRFHATSEQRQRSE